MAGGGVSHPFLAESQHKINFNERIGVKSSFLDSVRDAVFLMLALAAFVAVALFGVSMAEGAVTGTPLPSNTATAYGYSYKIDVNATDCTVLTSNTAAAIFPAFTNSSVTFPAGTRVTGAAIRLATPFAGTSGGVTSCNVKIGDGTDAAKYMFCAVGTNTTTGTWYLSTNTLPLVYNSATNLTITVQPIGAAITTLNAGKIEVYLGVKPLNVLTNN